MDDQLRFKRAEMLEDTSIQAGRNKKPVARQENKYSYNSLGQLTEASGGGVVYNYTYTPNGNVKDKLVNGSKALSYTYTASGKVAGIKDKSGKKTAYQYDKAGRVLSVSDNGQLVAEYGYYEDGTLRQVKFANGIYTEYIYNADKNYKNIVTKTAEGEILLDYSYAYDGNGNRTKKVGSDVVSEYAGNDSANGVTNYIYDSLQRLQEVSYPTGKVEQFQYDHAGNRALKKYGTAENFKTGNYLEERYQYDNRNRLLERKNPKDVTYYQYDKQGNTVSELTKRFLKPETVKTQNGSITTVSSSHEKTELEQYKTYEYDCFNKAAKVTVDNYTNGTKTVHTQENFYDAENLRYGIEEDNVRTNFVTNGWSVCTELDAEWTPTKRLVRGYSIVASDEIGTATITDVGSGYSNGYHYYHQNEHGDIEYITGKDGKVENAYTYDAFGNITSSTELVKNRYTYNGEQYDQVTQQYYLRARYYNPLVGRFTQEDVYRGDGLNLYAYCGSNPVMYVDPSGYSEQCGTGSESDINSKYVDSEGNVYDNAKDYLNGPAKVVNGDPLMYSMNNRNGGTVVLSTEPITGNSFINTLDYYNSQGRNVVILSGSHGSATGESGLGANRLLFRKSENAFCAERSFYYEDVNTANSYNNVKVYDITRMSDRKFRKILNSEDVTICAWCYSERSNDVINAVR